MINRWSILAVLFIARMAMAFQFQSVASLSPLMMQAYGISLADIGLLIGIYLAPGVIFALPGGAIAARFGDKRIVALSLVAMFLGSVLLAWGPGWGALVAGRVLAGVGGVVLNVVMTKLVVDWFAGREISTALGIFVNSWPVGIALALFVLPRIAEVGGLALAWVFVLALIALGFALFTLVYRAPEGLIAPAVTGLKVQRFPVIALVCAGAIWAFYNAALAMVFGFGPALLTERGLDLTAASSMTSLFMLVLSISLPLGGLFADRTGRRDTVIATGLLGFVLIMPWAIHAPPAALTALFVLVGFIFGLSAGPIVALPSLVLRPEVRAFAMGVYFTIYYLGMMVIPVLAGALAEATGTVAPVFYLGAGLSFAALVALIAFRWACRAASALE